MVVLEIRDDSQQNCGSNITMIVYEDDMQALRDFDTLMRQHVEQVLEDDGIEVTEEAVDEYIDDCCQFDVVMGARRDFFDEDAQYAQYIYEAECKKK